MDKDQEEQQRQQGSIDRVNDIINKARSARTNYKRVKRVYNAVKTIRTAAAAGETVEATVAAGEGTAISAPVLLIIALIVVVVILFAAIIALLVGPSNVAGSTQCTGQCQASCSGNTIQDTNATCPTTSGGQNQVCCIPQPNVTPGVQPPIHFYCQYASTWQGVCQISTYGCFPTSLAMIMASYGGNYTPVSIAQNTNTGCNSPTTFPSSSNALSWARNQGYNVLGSLTPGGSGGNFDLAQAQTLIKQGYYILGGANMCFRWGGTLANPIVHCDGHAVVISNVDPATGTLTYYDPTYCTSDTNYVIKTMNVNNVLFNTNGNGWFYAYPIKK